MAVIVEDGSIVSGANSYADSLVLDVYADNIGVKITGDADELLLRAALWLATLNYIGQKLTKAQRQQWPRTGAIIDGFSVDTDEIPQELIDLQCEVALSIDGGADPMALIPRETKSEKVGPIEVEYKDSSSSGIMAPAIYDMAAKLTGGSAGGVYLRMSRA